MLASQQMLIMAQSASRCRLAAQDLDGDTHGGASRGHLDANNSAFVCNGCCLADAHNDVDLASQLRLHIAIEEDPRLADVADQSCMMLAIAAE